MVWKDGKPVRGLPARRRPGEAARARRLRSGDSTHAPPQAHAATAAPRPQRALGTRQADAARICPWRTPPSRASARPARRSRARTATSASRSSAPRGCGSCSSSSRCSRPTTCSWRCSPRARSSPSAIPYSPTFLEQVRDGQRRPHLHHRARRSTASSRRTSSTRTRSRRRRSRPRSRSSPTATSCPSCSRTRSVTIEAEPVNQSRGFLASLILGFGPVLLLIGLFVYFARRAGGGGR